MVSGVKGVGGNLRRGAGHIEGWLPEFVRTVERMEGNEKEHARVEIGE